MPGDFLQIGLRTGGIITGPSGRPNDGRWSVDGPAWTPLYGLGRCMITLRNLERLVWRDVGGESTSVCVASRGLLQILADGRGNDTVRGRNVREQARP
jgi:hypothetical protein